MSDNSSVKYVDNAPLYYRFFKRLLDIIVSIFGMTVSFPFFVISCILIKLEDGGSVIFRQERVGYKGKLFYLYKLRSMTEKAEADGKPHLCEHEDKRLTKIGHFLRVHHLDEIPQLWNVLIGDMSFVGPRPERKYFVDKISAVNPHYEDLFVLRPGLFSRATLYNGYTDTMEKMLTRLEMDLEYLRVRCLWEDTKIVILTLYYILTGRKF